jgi:hypothetical protein
MLNDLAVEIPVDYFPPVGSSIAGKYLSNQDLHTQRSGTAIGGIAGLAAFKLQWNCPDRNIDRARRWGIPALLYGRSYQHPVCHWGGTIALFLNLSVSL